MPKILNKRPSHIIGAVEGLSQKLAYYGRRQSVSDHEEEWFLTSERNFLRCMRTNSPSTCVSNGIHLLICVVRLTGSCVKGIEEVGDMSINYLTWREHGQNIFLGNVGCVT